MNNNASCYEIFNDNDYDANKIALSETYSSYSNDNSNAWFINQKCIEVL